MTDIATISLRVNTGGLERGRDELTRFRGAANEAATSADKFNQQANQSLDGLNGQLQTARGLMMSLAGTMGGMFAVSSIVSQADAWGQTVSRLKMVTASTEELAHVQSKLMEISDRTFKSIDEQNELFIRSAGSMKELGYNAGQTVDFIDSVSSSLTINAASAEQGSRAITALSRAMVSGKLRGLEWEAVMEVMPTAIGDVATALGITENAVKSMARSGELSMKTFVNAMLQAQERNARLTESMPNTIQDALTRINNHFREYIGEANRAHGVTLSVAESLITLSDHMEGVINVAGILAGVGVARFFGNMTTSIKTAITSSINLRAENIRLAQTELANARAALVHANAQAQAARYDSARALTVENLRLAEARLASARLTQAGAIASVAAAENGLNAARSTSSRLLSRGLGLVGGIPGAIMLAAGAVFAWKVKIDQANDSAREYIKTLDDLKAKISGMSLVQVYDTLPKAQAAEALSLKDLQAQQNKVRELQDTLKALDMQLDHPWNHLKSRATILREITEATEALTVEQARLNEVEEAHQKVVDNVNDLMREGRQLLYDTKAAQDANAHSTLMMTGEHAAFNRVLATGNALLQARAGIGTTQVPLALPQETLTKEQENLKKRSNRNLELARAKDARAKKELQVAWALEDVGLSKDDPTQSVAYWGVYNNDMEAWQAEQDSKPKKATPKTDEEKAAQKLGNSYDNLIKQQKEQIALDGQHTEVAKMRYQLSTAELASLTSAQKQTLLNNAALIDQINIRRQLLEYERQLQAENQTARDGNQAELVGYGRGDKSRERDRERLDITRQFQGKDRELLNQFQDKKLTETQYHEQLELNKKYLAERLSDQENFWNELDDQQGDWMLGMSEGLSNWVDEATSYADQAAQATSQAISGLVDTMADALNDSKADWKDWGVSVLKTIEKIILNAAIAEGIKSAGNSIGGSFGDFLSGLVPNAKGGVYDSPSLSAYSNQIVSQPTTFAFAKGAGLMGEAGPEAIMPLTRTSNGQLGVKAAGGDGVTRSQAPVVHITITGDGQSKSKSSSGWERFAAEIGQFVDQRYRENMARDTGPGGTLWTMTNGSR